MKLCKECAHSETVGQYRVCLKLTPLEQIVQVDNAKQNWTLCMVARSGECGPKAIYYKRK